jgi:superfamily II DNA helicase RecQ
MTRTDAYRDHLKAIIVDEVHCVATWDFRPTYAWLRELEGRKIVCTATLTKRAEGKVLGILGLTLAQVFPIRRCDKGQSLYRSGPPARS